MTERKEIKRRLQFSFDYPPLCSLIRDGVKYKEKLVLEEWVEPSFSSFSEPLSRSNETVIDGKTFF